MNKSTILEISPDVRARRNDRGVWEMATRQPNGRMSRYKSVHIRGTKKELLQFVHDSGTLELVKKHIAQQLGDVMLQRLSGQRPLAEFEAKFKDWLTKNRAPNTAYTQPLRLRALLTFKPEGSTKTVGELLPGQVTVEMASEFARSPDSRSFSSHTQTLSAARAFFIMLNAIGAAQHNPFLGLRVDHRSFDQLSRLEPSPAEAIPPEVHTRILAGLEDKIGELAAKQLARPNSLPIRRKLEWRRFWRAALPIFWETGMRASDVCTLTWEHRQLQPDHLLVYTRKSGYRISLPLTPALKQALAQIDMLDERWCFPFQAEKMRDPAKRTSIANGFKQVLTEQRIDGGWSLKSYRHAFIQRHVDRLSDGLLDHESQYIDILRQIGKLVGHRHPKTTAGYDRK